MISINDFKSYFKRVKQPVKNAEEAKPIKKETLTYLLISLGIALACSILAEVIPVIAIVFQLVSFAGILVAIYFGIMLYAIKRVSKRLDNLTCSKCKTSLDNQEYATWEEISRRWAESSSDRKAEGKLYVTVKFTCKCPYCGEIKCFTETLCSGKITATKYGTDANVMPTQKLVDDYFNGLIHA